VSLSVPKELPDEQRSSISGISGILNGLMSTGVIFSTLTCLGLSLKLVLSVMY